MEQDKKPLKLYLWRIGDRVNLLMSTEGYDDTLNYMPYPGATLREIQKTIDDISSLYETCQFRNETISIPKEIELSNIHPKALEAKLKQIGGLLYRTMIGEYFKELIESNRISNLILSTTEIDIPWELMHDGKNYLNLKFPITRKIPVSRPIMRENVQYKSGKIKILFICDPQENLEGARKEIETIQRNLPKEFNSTAVYGKDIDRVQLLSSLNKFDIIHFSGHAKFDKEFPDQSCLIFNNGPVYASEIANLLSNKPPLLVFINACESSKATLQNEIHLENNVPGLVNAFISAGVRAYIGAMWPIHDEPASQFAITFYEKFAHGLNVGTSIYEARKEVYEKYGNSDITWAAYIVYGDHDLRIALYDKSSISNKSIQVAIKECVDWIKMMYLENGKWMDRVYRDQGIQNTCEVLNTLFEEGKIDKKIAEKNIIFILNELSIKGYLPSPYEPENLKEDFTETHSILILTILNALEFVSEKLRKKILVELKKNISWLLENQHENGGWNWGSHSKSIPCYTHFTAVSIEALGVALKNKEHLTPSEINKIKHSIENGFGWFVNTQRESGGWGITDSDLESNPICTSYAISRLIAAEDDGYVNSADTGINYLKKFLRNGEQDDLYYIDHRIIVPSEPQQKWPHYEDYSGKAAILEAFLSFWEKNKLDPELDHHITMLTKNLIENREGGKGWPTQYSTIYVSTYTISVLRKYLEIIESRGPE